MADITVTTDVSQINNLKEALKSADTAYVRVVDSIVRENNRLKSLLKKAAKDTEETNKIKEQADAIYTAKLEQESAKREKARAREAAAAEKEAQRIAAANQKIIDSEVKRRAKEEQAATSYAKGFQGQVGRNLGLGAAGVSASASASAMEAEIERLRQKYDTIYVSSQLYERSLQELNRAHMLGVTSAKQHEAAVESLNAEYQAFQNGVALAGNRFAQHVNQTASGMNQFGVVVQQAGYQVGDFLVQVQSGTNWMVAFGQQATQLVGILPLMGAGFMGLSTGALVALSAGLGIAIPLLTALGAAWFKSSEASNEATKNASSYKDALDGVIGAIKNTQTELNKLKFNTEDAEIANAKAELLKAEIEVAQARQNQRRIGNTIVPTNEEATAIREAIIRYSELSNKLRELEGDYAKLAIAETASKRAAHEPSGTYVEEAAAAERVAEARRLEGQYYAQTRMEANQTAGQVALIESGMSQAAVNALRFAGVDLSSGVSSAAKEAATLAANMGISLNAALSLMNMASSMTYGQAGTRGDPRDFIAGGEKSYTKNFRPFSYEPSKNGGGGGGGAAQEDALQKLREQIVLENELLGVSEAQKRVIQALGEQRSQYSEAEINAITAEIEAYNQKLEVLKQQEQLAKVMQSSMEDAFMSIIDGTMSAKDAFKKMAYDMIKELYRVLVVQRLVGSFQSGGGGILGAVFKGLGGRESGGSVMAGQPYMVGERGPEIVIPRHSGTVMNANLTRQAASGGGDVIVTNNINVPAGADSASIRAEVSKMIPQITQITKAAVIDAKQRGGQMAAAFR